MTWLKTVMTKITSALADMWTNQFPFGFWNRVYTLIAPATLDTKSRKGRIIALCGLALVVGASVVNPTFGTVAAAVIALAIVIALW